jgi:hypothetical protein
VASSTEGFNAAALRQTMDPILVPPDYTAMTGSIRTDLKVRDAIAPPRALSIGSDLFSDGIRG